MFPGSPPEPNSEERTWAMLSHVLGAAAILTGVLSWVPPLIIWLVKRDTSPFVAFHALQSLLFHVLWACIVGAVGFTAAVLSIILIGLLLIPVLIVLGAVPIIWSVVAGVKAGNGEWYQYPVVGPWAARTVGL